MSAVTIIPNADVALVDANAMRSRAAEIADVDELNQEEASALVGEISEFLKNLDTLRTDAIKPHLEAQRAINAKAKEIIGNLDSERSRLNRAIGDYGAVLAARARAEQMKACEAATQIEQETADAIASATSIDEITEIRERAAVQVAQTQIAADQIKPTIKVREDWEIDVVDAAALYAAHPEAVELKPRLSIIKALADAHKGALPGVICTRVNVARRR